LLEILLETTNKQTNTTTNTNTHKHNTTTTTTNATTNTQSQQTEQQTQQQHTTNNMIPHSRGYANAEAHKSLQNAIITINERGIIQSVDRKTCILFGYEPVELHGKKVNILIPSPYRVCVCCCCNCNW
jgi:PAS domain-containing protein